MTFQYDVVQEPYKELDQLIVIGSLESSTSNPSPDNPRTFKVIEESLLDKFGIEVNGQFVHIDLQGEFMANLGTGYADFISLDSNHHVWLTKRVGHGYITSANGEWDVVNSGTANWLYRSTGTGIPGGNPVVFDKYPTKNIQPGNILEGAALNAAQRLLVRWGSEEPLDDWLSRLDRRPLEVWYPLAIADRRTIDLGYIEIPRFYEDSQITVISNIEPYATTIETSDKTDWVVKNPYEPEGAGDVHIPPAHPGQEWETFNPAKWTLQEQIDYTYQPEWHAVYTVQLGELIQSGVFDWKRPELDWSSAAVDVEQYKRVCDYFIERFRYREISIEPFLEWAQMLKRKFVYELMPKYAPMYKAAESVQPLAESDEYYKRRTVDSEYPETLLSGNSDYASTGTDEEWERVKVGNLADAVERFKGYHATDELMLDELETMFISSYTSYVDGL